MSDCRPPSIALQENDGLGRLACAGADKLERVAQDALGCISQACVASGHESHLL